MAERTFSLHDRLTMTITKTMNVGEIIKITKISSIIDYIDSRTKEARKAVVVETDKGEKYYLPSTIGKAIIEMFENGQEAEARAELEGKTFRCEEFIAKRYGTKGKTLSLIPDVD